MKNISLNNIKEKKEFALDVINEKEDYEENINKQFKKKRLKKERSY